MDETGLYAHVYALQILTLSTLASLYFHYVLFILFVLAWAYTCHDTCVVIRGQLEPVLSSYHTACRCQTLVITFGGKSLTEPSQGPLATYFHAITSHKCLAPPRVGLRPEALPVNEVVVAFYSFCIFSLNVLIYEIGGTASVVVLPQKKKKKVKAHGSCKDE